MPRLEKLFTRLFTLINFIILTNKINQYSKKDVKKDHGYVIKVYDFINTPKMAANTVHFYVLNILSVL